MLLLRRTGVCMLRARNSNVSSATLEKSIAVTCWPRAARNSACLPVPQAISSAGPEGRSGKSSQTMLAGSEGGASAASLCLASQSDWLEGIKKAPEHTAQEPKECKREKRFPAPRLDAEGTPAAAGALHVGIVELESRTFNRLNIIDFDAVQIHGTHLVNGDLQTIKLENLVRIGGLVLKRHVVLETRAAATDYSHAQRDGHWALHAHDFLDLGTRNGRQIDHKSSWPPLAGAPAKLSTSLVYQNSQAALQPAVPALKRLVRPHFDKPGTFAYNRMQ